MINLLFQLHLVSGPSTVFRQYLEVGVSFLKDVAKKVLCRKVVGYDANALYLQFCGQEMPTVFYIDYELSITEWF